MADSSVEIDPALAVHSPSRAPQVPADRGSPADRHSNEASGTARWEKYLILAVRYFFGGHALMSGANHYLKIVPDIMPRSPDVAVRFIQVLLDTHLYDLVKGIEILTGLCLLTGLFVPVALLLEMPISVIICYLSLFIAPTARSFYTGPREVLFNAFLLCAYWGYFKLLVCQARPPLRPLWREGLFNVRGGRS